MRFVRRTPLERSSTLSRMLGTNVYLKYELFQSTGSFKPRGAFNTMLTLSDAERAAGVVGVSGGNFAQGVPTVMVLPAVRSLWIGRAAAGAVIIVAQYVFAYNMAQTLRVKVLENRDGD